MRIVHILIVFIRAAPTFFRVNLSLSTSLRMLSIFIKACYWQDQMNDQDRSLD